MADDTNGEVGTCMLEAFSEAAVECLRFLDTQEGLETAANIIQEAFGGSYVLQDQVIRCYGFATRC